MKGDMMFYINNIWKTSFIFMFKHHITVLLYKKYFFVKKIHRMHLFLCSASSMILKLIIYLVYQCLIFKSLTYYILINITF